MPYAERNRDRIDVLFNWNEKDRLLLLPGARYRRDEHGRDVVAFPLSWGSCLALRGMFGPELRLGEQVGQWAAEHRRTIVDPALALRSLYSREDADRVADYDLDNSFGPNLKPFQAIGLQWMMTAGSGILGDDMGSGKTVQALSFISRVADALPALVIVPNSVKYHWKNLAPVWAPRGTVYVVDGSAVKRRKILTEAEKDPDAIVVINLESVRSFSRLAPYGSIRLRRCQECDPKSGDDIKASQCEVHEKELQHFAFQSVFLDEAHRIGNPESKQTRAVWQVMNGPLVKYRWGLSGTVQSDHFGNLWSVLHAILPDDFPVKSKAIDRYCLTRANPIGAPEIIGLNPATRDELYAILDPHFRRMLKSVTSPQLPPVLRETRTAVLAAKHRKIYNDVEGTLFGDLGDGDLIITHSNLTKADRLQQIAAAAVEIEKPDEDDISTWRITMKDPSPKVDVLMEILEDGGYLTGSGAGAAVAAVHKDLIRLVSNRLTDLKIGHGIITGDYSPAERDVALARFQDGHDRVLLFTVAAGGTGLDMTAADLLVNLQRPWSMVNAVQTEGRVHRIGSEIHRAVRIIDIITEGTIEERQVERLTQKLTRLEEINRDTVNVPYEERDPEMQHEAELILNGDILSGPELAPVQQEYVSPFLPVGHEGEHHAMQSAPVTFDQTVSVLREAGADYPVVVEALREQLPAGPIEEAETPGPPIQQPERMDCPCCEKNTKVNADGTIRYHFSDKDECRVGPDSRRCLAVGKPWTTAFPPPGEASEDGTVPAESVPPVGYICRGCKHPVQLTKNGRARSHLDPRTNEPCPDGSDWPLAVDARGNRTDTAPEIEGESAEELAERRSRLAITILEINAPQPVPVDNVQTRTVTDVELPSAAIVLYCEKCDTDMHRCPGCGANVPHDTVVCAECEVLHAEPTPALVDEGLTPVVPGVWLVGSPPQTGDEARAIVEAVKEAVPDIVYSDTPYEVVQDPDSTNGTLVLPTSWHSAAYGHPVSDQDVTPGVPHPQSMTNGIDAEPIPAPISLDGWSFAGHEITGVWSPGEAVIDLSPTAAPQELSEPTPAGVALPAEVLPDQIVSATKINDWQQCKRKWWLRWYRQLDSVTDLTDVRNTGIRVHEALAAWYVPEGTERQDPRDVLREAIGRDWNKTLERMQLTPQSEGFEAVAKKWESVAVLERAMIEGYMEWMEETGADAGYTVIGSELEVAVNIPDSVTGMTVQARGVVDAKIRRDVDGVRLFIDHKSVGDFERATRFLKMRNQMLHYHLIEWLTTGEGEARCDGALYNMLRRVKRTAKAKPPFFQRKTVEHTEIQISAYRERLLGEAASMARAEQMLEAGVSHHRAVPPSPSDDCHWKCEFAAVCPMFDDGSRAEDMIAAVYHQGDPWQRYDLLGPGTTAGR